MTRFDRRLVALVATTLTLCFAAGSGFAQSAPAGLIVDVQVVDRDGLPIAAITADKFDVEVGGRKRRVLSAELVQASAAITTNAASTRQVYFIAVDALTFGPGGSKQAVAATRAFIASLPKGSLVGLFTFPTGPAVELTADHAAVASALDTLTGQRQAQRAGTLGLGTADVVEYLAANDRTALVERHCGTDETSGCPAILEQEVNVFVNTLETQARASLGMLAEFTTRLGQIPGRKVLVLVSGGLAVAERPGGRPDVGNLPAQLADAGAQANVALYTLFLDRVLESDRAENATGRQAPAGGRDLLPRWLDQFSATMSGALIRVQPNQTGDVLARIAKETGAFYRLVVETTDADGDRPQRLRVRVDQRGATLRSRTVVATK